MRTRIAGALLVTLALGVGAGIGIAEDTPAPEKPAIDGKAAPEKTPEEKGDRPVAETARAERERLHEEAVETILELARFPDGNRVHNKSMRRRWGVTALTTQIEQYARSHNAQETNRVIAAVFDLLPAKPAYDMRGEFARQLVWVRAPHDTWWDASFDAGTHRPQGRIVSRKTFRYFLGRYIDQSATRKRAKRQAFAIAKAYCRGFPVSGDFFTDFLRLVREDDSRKWKVEIRQIVDWVFQLADPTVAFAAEGDPEAARKEMIREIRAIESIIGTNKTRKIVGYLEGENPTFTGY